DYQLTWNTTNPYFTSCFEETVLFWIPCSFLWIFAPLEVHKIRTSHSKQIPWKLTGIFKIVLSLLLIIFSLFEMSHALLRYFRNELVYPVEYYTPFIKFLTFILVTVLMLFHRKKGIHTSGVLFFFWLFLSVATLINYRTILSSLLDSNSQKWSNKFLYTTRISYVPVVIAQFILCCFADARAEYFTAGQDYKNLCPAEFSSFLSQITFWWVNGLVILGVKRPLQQKDMWDLSLRYKTVEVLKRFSKFWNKSAVKGMKFVQKDHVVDEVKVEEPNKEMSIMWTLVKTFWPQLLLAATFKFFDSILTFVNPLILDNLITFVSSSEPYWKGYFYVLLMLLASITQALFSSQYDFQIYTTGLRMRSCMISVIYRKVALASFGTYVLMDSRNVLDPNKAFVSLSLFNILRVPLALLPMLITFGAMFIVSIRRINKYLQGDELDSTAISHDNDPSNPISVHNASFAWTKTDEPFLRDIDLTVKRGKLVAVVGQVGSGKSSLLSALLGDMNKTMGSNVIGPNGLLKNKTRLLVTHRITLLPEVDEIIVMKDGRIAERGSYSELLAKKGDFAEILVQFLSQTTQEEISDEDASVLEEIKSSVKPELDRHLSHISSKSDSVKTSVEDLRTRRSSFRSQSSDGKSPRKSVSPSKARLIEAETQQVGSIKLSVYKDYASAVGLLGTIVVLLSFAISNSFNVASSLWLSAWSDDALNSSNLNNTALRDLRLGVYGGLAIVALVLISLETPVFLMTILPLAFLYYLVQ
ncbi:canalicular multispecific organic anion transporter 2-like protein, partial [Dinothrombium tinctorium]